MKTRKGLQGVKMDKLIERLAENGMRRFMDTSRDKLAQRDAAYQYDCKDKEELAQRYESLFLSRAQRMVINDYIACTATVSHRYADISYMAGIRDAVGMLTSLGLIKDIGT